MLDLEGIGTGWFGSRMRVLRSGRLILSLRLRSVGGRNMSDFALRPSTIGADGSRVGRGGGGLMFDRERRKRRGILRLRCLFERTCPILRRRLGCGFEGISPMLRLRSCFEGIRSGHLRSGLESKTLGFGDLERSFRLLPAFGEAYRFRVLRSFVHVDHREWRFLACLGGIRRSKRALHRALRSDCEWRRLSGTRRS